MLTLVLGGVRSGKSAFAETLARKAENTGRHIVYIATGSPLDAEMASRIAHHRARRPPGWITVEEPIALAKTLAEWARRDRYLLVDCLTLWLSNLILADTPSGAPKSGAILGEERTNLIKILPDLEGEIVLVSNEVGMGLVSPDPLGRLFVDESGRLHQEVAALANNVYWVVAGYPIHVKGHEIGVDGT